MTDTSALGQRASELQKKIQAQLKAVQEEKQQRALSSSKVIMDDKGNIVDTEGNIITFNKKPVATTLINRKKQTEDRQKTFKMERPPDPRKTEFFDRSIGDTNQFKKKRKRGLNFHQQGTFMQEAKKLRSLKEEEQKQERQQPQKQTVQEAKPEFISGEIHLLYGKVDIASNPPPQVEWWDAFILNEPNYALENLKTTLVDNHILEHPLPIPPALKTPETGPIVLMLTAKERRKLRTQTRLQREKENQQKIRLGLAPAPPPKANLKNFMQVHLNSGTQDPTKLERQIRQEMRQRVQNHEDRNQDRKLTKEQRKQKKKQKLADDESKELQVAIFRVADLSHPANRFKVNVKASELGITGCVITCGGNQGGAQSTLQDKHEPMILIIAEGGIKAVRKYSHTILQRIDWSRKIATDGKEQRDDDDEDLESSNKQKCALIWNGILRDRAFKTFKFQNFADEKTAQKYLADLGLESYYNMASSWAAEAEIVEEE